MLSLAFTRYDINSTPHKNRHMTLLVDFVPGIRRDTGFDCMAEQPFSLAFHRYVERLCTLGSSMGNFESCAASHVITAYRKNCRKYTALAGNLLMKDQQALKKLFFFN